jgi:hypothetical protein
MAHTREKGADGSSGNNRARGADNLGAGVAKEILHLPPHSSAASDVYPAIVQGDSVFQAPPSLRNGCEFNLGLAQLLGQRSGDVWEYDDRAKMGGI